MISKNENIFSFPLDVTNKDECSKVFSEIKNKFEQINLCIFSAKLEVGTIEWAHPSSARSAQKKPLNINLEKYSRSYKNLL